AIALQPGNSNLILVGTGETNNAGDSYYGMGILRSTDGGSNWTLISTADSGAKSFKGLGVSKFAFSTANPNFVVAAVAVTALGNGTGLVPIAGSNSGLYWSSDAGATWHSQTSIVDGATPTDINRVFDVVYNPTLNKFFAAVRYHGFYSSTDG